MFYINNNLRLNDLNYNSEYILKHAMKWYEDEEVLYYSEGISSNYKKNSFSREKILQMYKYLSSQGMLLFIEIKNKETNKWFPIGDITIYEKELPLIIGNIEYRNKGLGKLVINKALDIAKNLNITQITNVKIYHYNKRSLEVYKKNGFSIYKQDKEYKYLKINLKNRN